MIYLSKEQIYKLNEIQTENFINNLQKKINNENYEFRKNHTTNEFETKRSPPISVSKITKYCKSIDINKHSNIERIIRALITHNAAESLNEYHSWILSRMYLDEDYRVESFEKSIESKEQINLIIIKTPPPEKTNHGHHTPIVK